jgi:site-specific DNA-methyltransferase (adenine-specific)
MKTSLLDIRHMDCMDLMREFPDKHFILAICDPPYGINAAEKGVGENTRLKIIDGRMDAKKWDKQAPPQQYFKELKRVSVNQIVWGGNYFPALWDKPCRGLITWDKGAGMKGRDFCEAEFAWTSIQTVSRIFEYDLLADGNERKNKIHVCQKPVALYRWLLANYAKPGQTILDTHLGSGSIAIACHYAGNPLTACELDADYYAAACERIERETRQADFLTPTLPRHEQTELL